MLYSILSYYITFEIKSQRLETFQKIEFDVQIFNIALIKLILGKI